MSDKTVSGFDLSNGDKGKVALWQRDCRNEAIARQKANPPSGVSRDILEDCWSSGYPYGGAIGGGLTYSFAPTSLGMVIKVHDAFVDKTLDLTEYDFW